MQSNVLYLRFYGKFVYTRVELCEVDVVSLLKDGLRRTSTLVELCEVDVVSLSKDGLRRTLLV